jgi:hypothetical protein
MRLRLLLGDVAGATISARELLGHALRDEGANTNPCDIAALAVALRELAMQRRGSWDLFVR